MQTIGVSTIAWPPPTQRFCNYRSLLRAVMNQIDVKHLDKNLSSRQKRYLLSRTLHLANTANTERRLTSLLERGSPSAGFEVEVGSGTTEESGIRIPNPESGTFQRGFRPFGGKDNGWGAGRWALWARARLRIGLGARG